MADDVAVGEQLELLRSTARRRRVRPAEPVADVDPVAAVVLDVPLPHLDRPFDYAVPASMADAAVPGVRVRVRFAGQEVGGFVVERRAGSEHVGRLSPLRRVASSEPVLTPQVLAAARAVADACAGTLADVLRLAVPPRHAATEKRQPADVRPADVQTVGVAPGVAPGAAQPGAGPWSVYRGGPAFLSRVAAGSAPRAVWTALPGLGDDAWPHAVAVAAGAALAADRGTLVVVPDHRDVVRVDDALTQVLGKGRHVTLTADAGAGMRYAAFLALSRGTVRVVVGTRAAAFAPVADLGLVVCWDDGDDSHAEPRAPYPHTRQVLTIRAEQVGAAVLIGSTARTAEAQQLLDDGWARELAAERAEVRRRAPRVVAAGDDDLRDPAARSARLPSLALRVARAALDRGPVLVQVPRSGYVPVLACQTCRAPARCSSCHGPLAVSGGHAVPACRWCGRLAGGWTCPVCDGERLRSVTVGSGRTAEELGRAFPGVTVRRSGGDSSVLAEVGGGPALVVATPGAEPVAAGGYAAALLLDAWVPLARPDLRAAEEALRRWLQAASLVRGAADGGEVVVVGDAGLSAVQALVRWDPAGHAARELAERAGLGLPPAVAMAEVLGALDGVQALLHAPLPPDADVLGPVPVEEHGLSDRVEEHGGADRGGADRGGERGISGGRADVRALVRVPRASAPALAQALHAARAGLSSRKHPSMPRVQVDPRDVG